MRERRATKYHPDLERLEPKQTLSVGGAVGHLTHMSSGPSAPTSHRAGLMRTPAPVESGSSIGAGGKISSQAFVPTFGYLVYRRTNPNRFNNNVKGPFGHVLVQQPQPVPGHVYNVLYLVMRNGTAQTFDASSGFTVTLAGQTHRTPILTGNEKWYPGQEFIFYVLTKKYYPIQNQVSGGFQFRLGGAYSVAIPGPSGIFLRLTYDPARFFRQLDAIVQFGQGAQGGAGIRFGMPDTAIYEFVSARTSRKDYGGLF